MSTTSRASKGGKNKPDKGQKTEKCDTVKIGDKNATKENAKHDEVLKQKVQTVIETTKRSEEEVCLALQECGYDVTQAVNLLFDSLTEGGQWSVKKKKNRQPSQKQDKQEGGDAGNDASATDEWGDGVTATTSNQGRDKDRQRSKSGGPRGGRHGDSRGWRGREKQENERNLGDSEGGNRSERWGDRRGGRSDRRGGPGRGGRGGGRAGGPGRFGNRGPRGNLPYNKQPIDTWDNNNSNTWDNSTAVAANNEESWDFPVSDEWTTEEYTGSLADTKVFTPSTQPIPEPANENQHDGPLDPASQQLGQTLQINQSGGATNMPSQSPVPMGALNAAQTKYLNQLTSQNTDKYQGQYQSPAGGTGQPMQSYTSASQTQPYGYVNSYAADATAASQPPMRPKTQRARVPPPSKIPSSAVEMPGELTMAYLDVQFGAMDFMSDSNSFDGMPDAKYGAGNNLDGPGATSGANLNDLTNSNQGGGLDGYAQKNATQNSISSALTQSLSSVDNIPTSEHVSGGSFASSRTPAGNSVPQSGQPQTSLDLNKSSDSSAYSQSSTYNSYNKAGYNSSYSGAQTSTTSSYQSGGSYVNSQSGSYNAPSANSYQNSYSSATSYQPNSNSNAFPSITQPNSYSANNQSYSQSAGQSVYNAGLNSGSAYGSTSTSQYGNYGSSSNHKLVKDGSGYENAAQVTTAGNSVSSTSLQSTVSASKTTTTAGKSSGSAVSSMPPGVATPVMSTPYNMLQMPFYQQPTIYSYEDVQLLQQRMPHMTTPYYDVSYQTPTTLTAVRGDHGAAAALGGGGYSAAISGDARFAAARGADSASPVPTMASTMPGQQTTVAQGHQAGPQILAGTAAPPYFFATHFNAVPNYPFYQLPTAASNAHGTNSSAQYAKPGAYSSAYGYDALNQTQDYGKGTYVSNAQGQKGGGGGATASSTGSSGNDLSAMYGKSHAALGKVNSYDKQAFHSGTPPPFTGALHGSQSAGLAPSGTGYAPQVYIPAMAPHQQHHSTQLMHQPLHQDSGNSSGQRSQASSQSKAGGKQYPGSYWNQS